MIINSKQGFTLVELIITLAVAAILLIVAVPGFYNLIQNNKVVSMANNFSAAVNLARMESIKRGFKVSICPAANLANTACGTIGQWAQGWIVFLDADNDNAINNANDLLKVYEPLPLGTLVTANSAIISFDGSGFLLNGPITLSLSAAGCYGTNGRQLNITSSGRLSVSRVGC